MKELHEGIQLVQLVLFVALAAASIAQWRQRKGAPAAWIAVAFGTLGAIVLVSRLLPEHPTTATDEWIQKVLVAVLALFPYSLYRFMASLVTPIPWIWIFAHILTAATVVFAFLLPEIPTTGEPRTTVFTAFVYLLLVQWVFLTARVVQRLWSAGNHEPTVTRRRMRTLSIGALTLAISLVISGAAPAEDDEVHGTQVATGFLALIGTPFFLLGFAPPRWVIAAWRRKDELALREAEIALIRAVTTAEVADLLLPSLSRFMGGRRSALYNTDRTVAGSYGMTEEDAKEIEAALAANEIVLPSGEVLQTARIERGLLVVVTSSLAPYFGDEERKTLDAIAVLTDMALARTELFDRERRNVETMRDFVAIASHDLRTPISVIAGIGSLVTTQWAELRDDERLELVSKVEKHALHLARLVEDLLTVSKMDADVLELVRETFDMGPAIREVVTEFGERAQSVLVEVNDGIAVEADPDHFKRMLRNYLTNAFTYGGDPIMITARPVNGWVEVRVSDRGEGVPEDFIPRLFDKFARADKKMSKATQGTGLGLSIVQGLARAMGGDAFHEPNFPTGATFGIRLMRART